jgi:hypothetical protein
MCTGVHTRPHHTPVYIHVPVLHVLYIKIYIVATVRITRTST